MKTNKGKKFPPEPLTRDEAKALMAVCSRRAPTGIRDRALICVLWRGALRVSEALALKESDIDHEECTLRILHGKGDKSRLVVLDWQSLMVLEDWLAKKQKLGIQSDYVFCTIKRDANVRWGPMNMDCVGQMLWRRAKKAGIKKRVHPHGLRHSGASELVADGYNLTDIQHQLGHASAATTARYLHLINPLERVERLRERAW